MHRISHILVPAMLTCALLFLPAATAQDPNTERKEARAQPKQYLRVAAYEVQENPDAFRDRDIQVADLFSEHVEQFTREMRRMDFTGERYWAFTTDRLEGTNMLCFVRRDNEDAIALFQTPLVPATKIYLMGTVGSQIVMRDGVRTVFTVDRVLRGGTPPPPKAEKKPLVFTMEWVITKPNGATQIQKKEYKIPEPGRYEIPDPYDPTKRIYMTFDF